MSVDGRVPGSPRAYSPMDVRTTSPAEIRTSTPPSSFTPKPRTRNEDATAAVIRMLEENMRHLEEMQEEKIRMRQEHQAEKDRLEEQMEQIVDQWIEQKSKLEQTMEKEKREMQQRMEEFRQQCEQEMFEAKDKTAEFQRDCQRNIEEKERELAERMAQLRKECEEKMELEKEAMTAKVSEFREEAERLVKEKEQMTLQMEMFRADCERKMAEEKDNMSRQTTEFQAALQEKLVKKEEEIIKEMAGFEAECERKMMQEKEELGKKTLEFHTERERMAQERAQMLREMEEFRAQCELEMAQEKQQATRRTQEFQAEARKKMEEREREMTQTLVDVRQDCERRMEHEREELERRTADFRKESDRMAEERAEMSRKMEEFRQQCEKSMADEKAQMTQKIAGFRAECEMLAKEKDEMTSSMASFREECERRMEEEKKGLAGDMAEFRSECEKRLGENEADMVRKTAEFNTEKARLEKEKEETMRQVEEFRKESERLAKEKEEMTKKMAEFHAECEAKMAEEKAEMNRVTTEFQKECEERMSKKEDEVIQQMAAFEADCNQKMQAEKEELQRKTSEFRAETERLEQEKVEINKQMTEFRAQCEQQMKEEEVQMTRRTADFQMACEKKMADKEQEMAAEMARRTAEVKAECERLEKEKAEMMQKMAEFRAECDRQVIEKAEMTSKMADFRQECEKKMEEKEAEMARKTEEFRIECEQQAKEKEDMTRKMADFRAVCEQKMAEEKKEMSKRTDEFFAECEKLMEANEEEMARQMEEFSIEKDRLEAEKEEMERHIVEFRAESEAKIAQEEAETRRKTAELREDCERKVAEEKAAAERLIEEERTQVQEKLKKEREITDNIMLVLKELPPLQTAMELGDPTFLDEELSKWRDETRCERFGECRGVVEAVVKLAQERLITWRGVEHTMRDVLREVERLPGSLSALTQQSQRVFRALKEAQLTKMDLRRSDPKALERIANVIIAWQERAMAHSNQVQKLLINKVVHWPQLGPFDFADLDISLRLVDRGETGAEVFLSRAQGLVQDETTAPKDLRALLSHVETMIFFLKYAAHEDLALTHQEFRKQAKSCDPAVASFLQWAEGEYPPGRELVKLSREHNLMDVRDVNVILEDLRQSPRFSLFRKDGLGPFREIFYQWALAMHSKFNLLVLPHHTQVVTLLAFRRFLESEKGPDMPHAVVAQVGTGEGKSMIVAALAIYVVVCLGKKAHIIVDDETLLERDFFTFKRLFDTFQVPCQKGERRQLSAVLCVSEERLATGKLKDPNLASRVDPNADICYCEAKHIQSFYASVARGEKRDFEGYDNRVLILDEVDALVIDEEPNEAFVYPNKELSEMATSIAMSLMRGTSQEELRALHGSSHPAACRVVAEMCKEWARGQQMKVGDDFVFVKDIGKCCAVHAGRANTKAWSLALECRNFQDGFSRHILFQERLFVMSRPRVFRRYHRIVGLSGSIGSKPEREFLRDTYKASFFEVPPFLKTCKGSPFHEAVPARLGQKQHAVYVESSFEAQVLRLADVCLEVRERVPVLVIAKDRAMAEQLVDRLRQAARTRGLGSASEDIVRSLSRTLYESDPEQWKENLNRATMSCGGGDGGTKSWRITVTDPRGGRGTDYRVDDQDADSQGGLLLVPTIVPTSRRDWTQYLGRTARQDRRGQFCCVLCAQDYKDLSLRYNEVLPTDGSLKAVEMVLSWGDREAARRIQGSAALYNTGVRVNELCEEVFGHRPELLRDGVARESLVDICQKYRWMSVTEVDQAFRRLPGMDPMRVRTEAKDHGRPAEPPKMTTQVAPKAGPHGPSAVTPQLISSGGMQPPKVVIFALDWSASMMSRDTRTPLSRFETCAQCVQRILRDQVRECDLVGVVGFGPSVNTVVAPVCKGRNGQRLDAQIGTLRPQSAGGTCFYDAVLTCLQLLGNPQLPLPPQGLRWLVCLTDGDDLGSQRSNMNGELVTHTLATNPPQNLNMAMITVGPLKATNLQIIDSWVHRITAQGGTAQRMSENDASSITKAFDVVAECLAAEVGGATEC